MLTKNGKSPQLAGKFVSCDLEMVRTVCTLAIRTNRSNMHGLIAQFTEELNNQGKLKRSSLSTFNQVQTLMKSIQHDWKFEGKSQALVSEVPNFIHSIEGLGQLLDFQFTCYNELHNSGELISDIEMANFIYQYLWSYKEILI